MAALDKVDNNVAVLPKQVPIPKKQKLLSIDWFHGKMSRADAEKVLQNGKNGEFLVRESRNFVGDLTISVHYESRVEHYRIMCGKQSFLTIDRETYFESISKLVEHYSQDSHGLCTRLKYPVKIDQPEAEMWQGEYLGKQVAIKIVQSSPENVSKNGQKLEEISTLLSSIQHNNLATFIGISINELRIYFVTEHIMKGSLVSYLRSRGRKHFPTQKLLSIACQICSGMCYLESISFIHGNLAAHNVLLEDDDTVKVTDFGLSQIIEDILLIKPSNCSIRWKAPEVLRSKTFSNKADVWSFGIMLWELFSYGRIPYPGKNVEEIPSLVESGYQMSSPDNCPESVYQIMLKVWHKIPVYRPNFSELYQHVQSIKLTSTTQ